MTYLISKERSKFHEALAKEEVMAFCGTKREASNSDTDNRLSKQIAGALFEEIGGVTNTDGKLQANTVGKKFEECCRDFLRKTFLALNELRPGSWQVLRVGSDINKIDVGNSEQYQHLAALKKLAAESLELKAALGTDYLIAPDVVIFRAPESDTVINRSSPIVDTDTATRAALRKQYQDKNIMHACISCKWTMRSDRAQNTRTEALNLIRDRKGRTPHIAAVTGEPLPSRISSLALGTGDLDCTYHIALYELVKAVQASESSEGIDLLETMIEGKRLKDISDLPLDLAV